MSTCYNLGVSTINDVPVLSRADIDNISHRVLSDHLPSILSSPQETDVEYLIENVFKLRLECQNIAPDGSILGETVFRKGSRTVFDEETQCKIIPVEPGTIIIDSTIFETVSTRTRFTEAHELGHWLLHQLFYGKSDQKACRTLSNQRSYFAHREAKNAIDWTEWQANAFAAALLIPKVSLRIELRDFLLQNSISWNELCHFEKYKNRVLYVELIKSIASTYGVSTETARIRLNKLAGVTYP